ncbi:hypothetical protein TRFO_42730 [Tritrichomonas foetus]|uniref:Intimal thickness related receptor IRP domain-containing protein n=1 Tax=Tritrichomonas foetus TaxID=1144522 RepID=A0A1J4KZN3_9EUKA|nr:hypothetical protein TRFO_42730 [Tritrichomonas foetus]|eukprot:OHT15053.1 hypothetical protein TRFO_42730 [Tritrichomonas foetus]
MFLLNLLFTTAFRGSFSVQPNRGFVSLSRRFGFQAGGNYSIDFYDAKTDSILVLIAQEDEATQYMSYVNEINHCKSGTNIKYVDIVPITNGEGHVFHKIDEDGMYYTILSSCTSDSGYSFTLQYINPNSYLSSDEQPCLITMPIVTAIVWGLFILWMVNWIMNFSLKNSLHIYMTAGIFLSAIYYCLFLFEVIKTNKTDNDSPIFIARKVFRVLQETVLLSAFLMASEGWCIIKNDISKLQMIICCVVSVCVTVPFAVNDFATLSRNGIFITIFAIAVSNILFIVFMSNNTRRAREYVAAHLYVIAEEGIDPVTTPVYKKFQLFRYVTLSMLTYFFVLVTRSMYSMIWPTPMWVIQLIYDVIMIVLISIIAFVFRMKKDTINGYMMIGDEEQEPRIFDRTDLETIDYTHVEGSTRPYEEGMQLPAQPFITNNKKAKKKKSEDENEEKNLELLGENLKL